MAVKFLKLANQEICYGIQSHYSSSSPSVLSLSLSLSLSLQFATSDTTRTLNVFRDGFDRFNEIAPVVWALDWHEGFDYIIVSTSNSVCK